MQWQEANNIFQKELDSVWGSGESRFIFRIVMAKLHQLPFTETISPKPVALSTSQQTQFFSIIKRLREQEPIQYILEETEFMGLTLRVTQDVLIPRPETEELIEEVTKQFSSKKPPVSILDIGTGSGCIAISLAKIFPDAAITAIDISDDALTIAAENAAKLNVSSITFQKMDILTETPNNRFDLVVSNPPYIPLNEKQELSSHVVTFEPHLALFCQEDGLSFYRRLADTDVLNTGGMMAWEIHHEKADEVIKMLSERGITEVQVIRDLSGKKRILHYLHRFSF